MADASKLKRLGSPPPLDEARTDLVPEPLSVAPDPALPVSATQTPASAAQQLIQPNADDYQRVDGRTLRKTGRTVPFSTRVREKTDALIRNLSATYHPLLISEVVELGALLLEQQLKQSDNHRLFLDELRQKAASRQPS